MQTLTLTNPEEQNEKHGYEWKIIVFGIVGIVLAFVFGFSLASFLFKQTILVSAIWPLLVSFLLFLANFALESLFSESSRALFLFFQSVAMVVGFFLANISKFMLWEFGWAIVLFLLFLLARKTIRNTAEGSLKLKWHHVTRKGIVEAVTAILLFASISFGATLWQKAESGYLFSDKTLASILNSGNFIVRLYYKNFDWNMTVDDFVEASASKTINSIIEKTLGKTLDLLPDSLVESQKNLLLAQSSSNVKSQLSQLAGFNVSGSETISSVLNRYISNKLSALPIKVYRIAIGVITILLFVVLKFFAPLIGFIVRILGYLFYEFLLAIGFASTIYEGRTKETVYLK